MDEIPVPQSLTQRIISLATSEHASTVFELLKQVMQQPNLVGETEFETVKNAITLDVQANILKEVVDYLDKARKGELHIGK